jgi:ABC-2 type transport system ATP-binding protein
VRDDITPGTIRAEGLGRRFEITAGGPRSLKDTLLSRRRPAKTDFWALRDVNLSIEPGHTFGVVGRNGSGKSTLLSLIARIFRPSEGTIEVGGRVGSLLDVGAGFHPEFTGVENVYLSAAVHGLSRDFVSEKLEEIIAFSELEEFAHMPVKTYSSGMFLRLGIAVAFSVKPDILLVDEVLAVGDEAFQQKCYSRIGEFQQAGGTMVFVSHDGHAVLKLCDTVILLEHGRVVESGPPQDVLNTYHLRSLEQQAIEAALIDIH